VRDLLWVLYLRAKQCVSPLSVHSLRVSVSHFRLLKWETLTFISSGLWLQHPDLNPMKYKICIKIYQRVFLGKFHNVTTWTDQHCGMTGMSLSNASSITLQMNGVNVYLCVCSCERTTFLVFSLTAGSTFVHFNVSVWWKLMLMLLCCIYQIFTIFDFFTFHKVVWLHS